MEFNDLALLKLHQSARINRHVAPVCLPKPTGKFSGGVPFENNNLPPPPPPPPASLCEVRFLEIRPKGHGAKGTLVQKDGLGQIIKLFEFGMAHGSGEVVSVSATTQRIQVQSHQL